LTNGSSLTQKTPRRPHSFDGTRQNITHSFDARSAFMSLSLQAHSMGLKIEAAA
jgi:hypothetical protein